MKKILGILLAVSLPFLFAQQAFADAVEGDVLLILGENLTAEQKEKVLKELGNPTDATAVTVTNAEEHQYLGKWIAKNQIGTKALSSAKIVIGKKDSGLSVQSSHINGVTNDMYTNALITAGVKDAAITITAPMDVSGTAALTGLIKAYEVSTDTVIPEEQKQVANEEMVKSAQLADQLGKDETNALMTNIKEEIAKQKPQNEEEMRALIQGVAKDMNITIPEQAMNGLVDLFMKMVNLDIDWNAVGDQLEVAKQKFNDFVESEEGQNLIQAIQNFFTAIFDVIKSWFSKE